MLYFGQVHTQTRTARKQTLQVRHLKKPSFTRHFEQRTLKFRTYEENNLCKGSRSREEFPPVDHLGYNMTMHISRELQVTRNALETTGSKREKTVASQGPPAEH